MTQSASCGSAARAASQVLRLLRRDDSAVLKPALDRLDAQCQRRAARSGLEAERWELLEAIAESLGPEQAAAGRRVAAIRLLEHLASAGAAGTAARRRPTRRLAPGRPFCCRP